MCWMLSVDRGREDAWKSYVVFSSSWNIVHTFILSHYADVFKLVVVEALRQGCHSRLQLGERFAIDPTRIFTTSTLPPNTESVKPFSENKGGGPKNLVLIIVLPIVGFLLILLCLGVGCCLLVRRRWKRRQSDTQQSHLHERWNDTSIITPVRGGLQKFLGEPSPRPNDNVQTPNHNYGYPGHHTNSQDDVKCPPEAYMMTPYPSVPESETRDTKKPSNTADNVPIISIPTPRKFQSSS